MMHRSRSISAHGFTVVELLVVIAVLSLLVALLLPALSMARRQARLALCQANIRGVGTAMLLYEMDQTTFPQGMYPQMGISSFHVYHFWSALYKPYVGNFRIMTCPLVPRSGFRQEHCAVRTPSASADYILMPRNPHLGTYNWRRSSDDLKISGRRVTVLAADLAWFGVAPFGAPHPSGGGNWNQMVNHAYGYDFMQINFGAATNPVSIWNGASMAIPDVRYQFQTHAALVDGSVYVSNADATWSTVATATDQQRIIIPSDRGNEMIPWR